MSGAGAQPAGDTHWIETKTGVTVPNDGSWNKVEVFWRRGPTNSRFWMAINGVQLVDRAMGTNLPVNRIMPSLLYTGGRLPAYQWIDDRQIWADFPPAGCAYPQQPWCNPPYAAH